MRRVVIAKVQRLRQDSERKQRGLEHADEGKQRGQSEDEIKWRQDPQNAAKVKEPEADRSGNVKLDTEQRGDQITTQEEEDRYAEAARKQVGQPGMRQEHQQKRHRADTVKRRDVH